MRVGRSGAGRSTKDDRFDELLARLDRIAAALETLALRVAPGERVAGCVPGRRQRATRGASSSVAGAEGAPAVSLGRRVAARSRKWN
ncbi:hypothetical protein LLG88_12265 [bacterium]|nr:hypothetical protein [bacterium]